MNKKVFLSGAALVALVFTGCESTGISSRINEKSAVFASLTPEQQKYIKEGAVEVGYTSDMVYMALGKPSKVKRKDSPDGVVEMWTYNNYYPTLTATSVVANSKSVSSSNWSSMNIGGNAPGLGQFAGASLSSTVQSGPRTELGFADIPTHTLYVLMLDGKVFDLKLERDGG
ncbi:MAG: hypothetical protein K9M98_02990 [Cephaloticoccus sp.]|nr:hypothetical protein [Cephaloticoccus sp.]MCF7759447.1 hypothetical protein [Cephaloticoccus sp.]